MSLITGCKLKVYDAYPGGGYSFGTGALAADRNVPQSGTVCGMNLISGITLSERENSEYATIVAIRVSFMAYRAKLYVTPPNDWKVHGKGMIMISDTCNSPTQARKLDGYPEVFSNLWWDYNDMMVTQWGRTEPAGYSIYPDYVHRHNYMWMVEPYRNWTVLAKQTVLACENHGGPGERGQITAMINKRYHYLPSLEVDSGCIQFVWLTDEALYNQFLDPSGMNAGINCITTVEVYYLPG